MCKDEEISSEKGSIQVEWDKPSSIDTPFLKITRNKSSTNSSTLAFSVCHRIPERSIIFRGKPILCFRCAGIYSTFVLLIIYQIFAIFFTIITSLTPLREIFISIVGTSILDQFLVILALHVPLVVDGGIQAKSQSYESKNWLRFLTGALAGIGQAGFWILLGSIIFLF